MQKELNPQLFPKPTRLTAEEMMSPPVEAMLNKVVTAAEEVQVLRRQVLRLQEQVTKLSSMFVEQNKSQILKADRWMQALNRLEQSQASYAKENNEKIAQLSSRLTEKRGMELKAHELVEQQNNMLKSFEDRFQKLQKANSEKDIQINMITGQLQEAIIELNRLRRSGK